MKIKKSAIENICDAARNTYPNEFIALLGSKDGVIEELVVLPATYGRNFSSLRIDLLPPDSSVVGNIHSHPSPNATPSKADIHVFRKTGQMHLIIAYPFSSESIKAYNAEGNSIELEVIE